MRVDEALRQASEALDEFENPQKIARVLLENVLKKDSVWLVLNGDFEFNEDKYLLHVERVKQKEPLEYVLGFASFYSLEFIVKEGVLVPRPETELLVDVACEMLGGVANPRILEVGVGSGIISTMLALKNPTCTIIATDISEVAIKNAKENFVKFGVEDRVKLVHTSYFDGVVGEFDLLVSNPPYIANGEALELHVLNEPHTALFGGVRGDEILQELISLGKAIDLCG